ncbi:phosphopantheine-transferase PgaX [Streptomyces sp. NPDC051921]|uniref:4'-phosphopantetheinyl transferase family protein n=1 Tax=Streptomyces sp. NPDC051921 TaxID=3155806 RepID=UPI0034164862
MTTLPVPPRSAVSWASPAPAAAGRTAGPGAWPVLLTTPSGHDADLWLLRLPHAMPARHELDLAVLDANEQRRADSFVHAADRAGYAAAHIAVRKVLGAYLGLPPTAVRFRRDTCPCCGGPHGRPTQLAAPPPYFSLAHSGGVVLIGVAGTPVGVSVERLPSPPTVSAVSGVLPTPERAEVSAAAPERRAAVFARLWARRQAVQKGRGDAEAEAAPGWCVTDFPVDGAHVAVAVRRAAAKPEGRVTLHELGPRGVLARPGRHRGTR